MRALIGWGKPDASDRVATAPAGPRHGRRSLSQSRPDGGTPYQQAIGRGPGPLRDAMKLKQLEIVGFKSFQERTVIQFPKGISAIVGPNGCGKSNVFDAIRWVMGEQSVKQLRGKAMEDVIFSGTNGRQPLNLAEVTLTLLNDNGSAPEELKDFTEIELTRRLYRSGERDYFINRQPCRLKDIYNVFYGSGMGAKSYAVIQQGNIGAITDADPHERRIFVEEAAGVTRYKNRKTEALRKLEATNQNLLRLKDIIAEIERQMAVLQRQAKKAEHYKHLQQRLQELEVRLAIVHFNRHGEKIAAIGELLQSLKDQDTGHSSQLHAIDAAIEKLKLERMQIGQRISAGQSQQFELQRTIDKAEAGLAHCRSEIGRLTTEIGELTAARATLSTQIAGIDTEIAQAQAQLTDIDTQIAAARTDLAAQRQVHEEKSRNLDQLRQTQEKAKAELMELVAQEARTKNIFQTATANKETLARRLKRADEEEALAAKKIAGLDQSHAEAVRRLEANKEAVAELSEAITMARAELETQKQAMARQVKIVQTLEINHNKAKSQHGTLRRMEENCEWYRDGAKAILTAGAKAGVDAVMLADVLEPSPSYETAVEAALSETLQYLIVADQQAAGGAMAFLQQNDGGRSGFVPRQGVKPMAGPGPAPELRLLNHVTVKPGFEATAAALLGHVAVVDDLAAARELFNANGRVQTVVTRNGEVITHQGLLIGGSADKLDGILIKKQQIRHLARQMEMLARKLESARLQQKEMAAALRLAESVLQKNAEEKAAAAQAQLEAEKHCYQIGEERKHAQRHLDIVRLEQEQLAGESDEIEAEMARYRHAVAQIEQQVVAAQQTVAGAGGQIEKLSAEVEAANQVIVNLKLTLTSLTTHLENGQTTIKRLTAFGQDGSQRLAQIDEDLGRKETKRRQHQQQIERDGQALGGLYETLKRCQSALEADQQVFAGLDGRLTDTDRQIAQIQEQREAALQKIRLLELEQSQEQIKRETIAERITQQFGQDIAQLRGELDQDALGTEAELEDKIQRDRDKLSRLADVNLGAIKQYEQLKERFDFLCAQRDDLVKAIEDLHKVIRKINRITQERFVATFEAINAKLTEVFPRLFEGGSAQLVLTEPDSPLESGVELMIQPPGKKVTRLSLLSGGEKALSAIAFIFAIFLIKPASFCLMDEIDAPLDEANVMRFNNLLKLIGEQSQVIMITHNKRTMEFADTLLGVTMEQKGVSKVVSVNLERVQ